MTATHKALKRVVRAGTEGVRVAVAESLTSGSLCAQLGEGESASEWFAGGVVAYFTRTKEKLLGLPPGTDPCSSECATHLADRVRRMFDADVSVSTTGVGGPEPQDGHAPGTVYLGWATESGTGARLLQLEGDPESVLRQTVEQALELIAELAEEVQDTAKDRAAS